MCMVLRSLIDNVLASNMWYIDCDRAHNRLKNNYKTPLRGYALGSRPIHSPNGPVHEKTALIVNVSTSGKNKIIKTKQLYSIC